MKRFAQIVVTAIIALFGLAPVASVHADTTSATYQNITSMSAAFDDLYTFLQDENVSQDEFFADYPKKAQTVESKIDDTIAGLNTATLEDNEEAGVQKLIGTLQSAKTALQQSRTALADGDQDAFTAAMTTLDTATTDYNTAIDELNKATTGFTQDESNTLYYGMAIATGLLSAAVFAWAFYKRPGGNEKLAAARRDLAISTLWPLGGALFTLGTYIFTTDGTFFIAWGPIAIGAAFFVKGVWEYIMLRKSITAPKRAT